MVLWVFIVTERTICNIISKNIHQLLTDYFVIGNNIPTECIYLYNRETIQKNYIHVLVKTSMLNSETMFRNRPDQIVFLTKIVIQALFPID